MLHATFLSISSICWSGKLLHEFAPFATHCGMTSQEWNSTKAENEEFWKAPRFALCSLATVNHETTQSTLKVLKEGETWTWQCAIWAMKTVKNYDLKRRCRCGILRFFWGYSAETSRTLRGAWSLTLVTIARNSCFLFGDIETSDFWVRCRRHGCRKPWFWTDLDVSWMSSTGLWQEVHVFRVFRGWWIHAEAIPVQT